jgi:hypothetical protein
MPISYAKLWPYFTTSFSVDENYLALLGDRRMLLFDPVQERVGTTSTGQRLRQVDPSVRECDLLFLRVHLSGDHEQAVRDAELLQRLTSAVSIVSLIGATEHGPQLDLVAGERPEYSSRWLDLLRSIEIEAILRRTGALFKDPRVHYLLPSQDHSDSFLRIGDALHDPTEVSRIADWVSVHINRESILIGDNGSLLSLLLMVQIQLRDTKNIPCYLRTISEYPVSTDFLEQLLDDVITRHPGLPIVFVISVNSSGRLLERIQRVAPIETRVLIVCDVRGSTQPANVVTLHYHDIKRFPIQASGKCIVCSDRPLVGIDSRTYERIPNLTFERLSINVEAAQRHSEFWEAVDRADAVHLHHDAILGEAETRHHGIYLDIPALLQEGNFRTKVIDTLRSLPKPELVLVPEHPASQGVVDVVVEAYVEVAVIIVGRRPLPSDVQRRISRVPSDATILIADDALIQGTTIRGLRQAIYRVVQTSGASPRIRAFVCLARPDSQMTYKNAARPFRDHEKEQLYQGYLMFLPNSGERDCPWCRERAFLSRIAPQLRPDDRATAVERRGLLESGELGNIFLWDTDELTGREPTKDSFFGQLGPKTAFAAAAGAAHEVKLQLKDASTNNKVAVLDVPMVMASYFESVFLAAILRTLDRRDLFYAEQQDHICEELARFPIQRAYPGTVAELGWAAANNKLPKLAVAEVLRQLPASRQRGLLLSFLEERLVFPGAH